MECAWQAYLNILPPIIRQEADKYRSTLLETRMRLNLPVEFVTVGGSVWMAHRTAIQDMTYSINIASKYSPWSSKTISRGYLTAPGGHRIGVCGEAVYKDFSHVSTISVPTSLCIRVARDFPGIAGRAKDINGSIVIIGPPGSGKTTLIRDIIRQKSNFGDGCVGVVDERKEIFPHENNESCFHPGKRTDILSGCRKGEGIEILLRCMTPRWIAVDEITSQEDCDALIHACWCGTRLICTAHAESRQDLFSRPVYRPLITNEIFDWLIVLQQDKSWRAERMAVCSRK